MSNSKTVCIGMPDMETVTSIEMDDVIQNKWDNKTVPAFIGPPGCGKSARVKAMAKKIAKAMGLEFHENPTYMDWHNPRYFNWSVIIISQIEEIDTKGLPINILVDGKHLTVYAISEMFPDAGVGIIFLDEFFNGRTNIQNALQSIILDKVAGNIQISKDIMFIIAGNRPQDGCGTFMCGSALKNRAAWYEVTSPNTIDWVKAMIEIGEPIDHRIAGFLINVGEDYANNFDPDGEQYAFGTRRSWTLASNEIRGELDLLKIKKIVGGRVGAGAAVKMYDFLKLSEKVNIKELLENPQKILKFQNDPGTVYSVCVNLGPYAENDKTVDKVFKIIEILDRDEFGLLLFNNMLRNLGNVKTLSLIKASPTALKLTKKYLELIGSN